MASVDQPFSPESDPNGQQNGSSANSNVGQPQQVTSGQSGTTTNMGSGTSGAGAAAPTAGGGFGGKGDTAGTQSGAYPNLQQYMSANQNWQNGQGQTLGGSIAGNLNQQGQQVGQANQSAISGFENQGNQWQQNTQNAANTFAQGLSNPYGFTSNNPTADQTASQALNAQYQGPQSVESSNPNLQQNTQNYVNTAQQTQTEPGRFNLLQQMFGGNNYTQGQQNLDNALLQTNPQQMSQLQGAAQQATQQNQNLTNAQNLSQNQSQNWQNFANQTQQGAASNLNNATTAQGNTMQNEFTQAQAAQQTAYQNALAGFQSGSINQNLANQVGMNVPSNEVIYNVDPSQYLTQAALTAQNTATAGDYQNVGALQQLGQLAPKAMNAQNNQLLSQYAAQPGTLYNSGNDILFNNAGFNSAVGTAGQNWQNAIAGDIGQINSLGYNPYTNYQGTGQPSFISNAALVNSANVGAGGTTSGPQNGNALGNMESLLNQFGNTQNADVQAAGVENGPAFAAPGTQQNTLGAFAALQNLYTQNGIYDPTRTLSITPNSNSASTPALAAMMQNQQQGNLPIDTTGAVGIA